MKRHKNKKRNIEPISTDRFRYLTDKHLGFLVDIYGFNAGEIIEDYNGWLLTRVYTGRDIELKVICEIPEDWIEIRVTSVGEKVNYEIVETFLKYIGMPIEQFPKKYPDGWDNRIEQKAMLLREYAGNILKKHSIKD